MILSNEQLEEVTEFAQSLMTRKEVALILGVNATEFIEAANKPDDPIYQAYMKGYLQTRAAIRKSVVTHASAGSSPAQTLAVSFMEDIEMEQYD